MSDWQEYKVVDIASRMSDAPFGSNLKTKDYIDDGVIVIQGNNIQGRKCDWTSKRFVSEEKYKSLARHHANIGSLIFPKVGTIAKVGILSSFESRAEYLLSTNTMSLEVNPNIANRDFVYYYFNLPTVINHIQAISSNSVQPVFNFTSLKNYPIRLPLLKVQTAIAEILSSLDDKIELNNQINKELEALAQALFKQWFIDFEFPNENGQPYKSSGGEMVESELGEIPKGWRVGILDELLNVKGGTTPSTKEPDYWDGEYNWTSPKDLSNLQFPVLLSTEKKITKSGLDKVSSGLLPKGTLLLSSRAPIGYLAITEIETAINQGYIAINCKDNYSNLFMLYWLRQNMDSVIERANGSTFLEISKTNFKGINVIIPSIEIHDRFINIIESQFELLICNVKENEDLKGLRDSLLPKLISGELTVKDI